MSVGSPSSSTTLLVRSRHWFGDLVLLMFLCVQVLDGVLTYFGVATLGVGEGNPIIAFYMHHLGIGPSLTAAKLLAIGCAFVLHVLAFHRVLAVLTLIYLSMAIVPWTVVLFFLH